MDDLALCIDEKNIEEGTREILKKIRPYFNQNQIRFKVSFLLSVIAHIYDYNPSKRSCASVYFF